MKIHTKILGGSLLSIVALFSICSDAPALTYTNANVEAMLCFRVSGTGNPFDLEVNIGSITNLTSLPIGSNVTISKYTVAQLTNAVGATTFEGVEFSVTASVHDSEPVSFPFPGDTVWATLARSTPSVQSKPVARAADSILANTTADVDSLGNQAAAYSGARSADALINTGTAVAIPPGSSQSCEVYIGPASASKLDKTFSWSVENRAPAGVPGTFSNALLSDLYIDVPSGSPDPFNTNALTGNASFLGFFTFNTNGTLTFTRALSLPARPTLTLTQIGRTNVIAFPTTSGTTYTISFTNSAGLSAPFTNWPKLTNIIGDGLVDKVTNSTTDAIRFYRASAHN